MYSNKGPNHFVFNIEIDNNLFFPLLQVLHMIQSCRNMSARVEIMLTIRKTPVAFRGSGLVCRRPASSTGVRWDDPPPLPSPPKNPTLTYLLIEITIWVFLTAHSFDFQWILSFPICLPPPPLNFYPLFINAPFSQLAIGNIFWHFRKSKVVVRRLKSCRVVTQNFIRYYTAPTPCIDIDFLVSKISIINFDLSNFVKSDHLVKRFGIFHSVF